MVLIPSWCVGSVVPDGRDEAEPVAGLGHVADRREREVGRDQLFTAGRQVLEQLDPDPGWKTASPANVSRSPPDSTRTMLCPGV